MEILEYKGPKTQESPNKPPPLEELEQCEREGRIAELVRKILEWKGKADFEYFRAQWDLQPYEVREAVDSLEDVEIGPPEAV